MTPEALRGIAAKIRQDVASSHFGDPRYAVVISADKADALTAAIPELLAQVADLERRLSIAAELTVADHQKIQALETRQQEQEHELGSSRAKAAALEAEGPCEGHKTSTRQGPRIVKSPKPRRVQCDTCDSTIEYTPEDLFRTPSLPCSNDVGPLAVKCPKCEGRGYPR